MFEAQRVSGFDDRRPAWESVNCGFTAEGLPIG